jgi:flagellar basal-body rod modification protein FlgD
MATIGSATSTSTTSAAAKTATIAQNFETFLSLLTTQLKNQSPLDPLDTNQFTQQLVQFAGVEQQLKSNESLTLLLAATKANTITNALGFVGAKVTADGATTRLSNGAAEWRLQAPRSVANATITITNATGSVVQTETRSLSAGDQTYVWKGRTSTGAVAPDGDYRITISARDPSGQPVSIRSEIQGVVDSVDVSGTEPVLSIGTITIPVNKVKTVQRSA